MKKNFRAIAISVLLIYLFHVLDLIFPGFQDSSNFFSFALSLLLMVVVLFVGLIQIIVFQIYEKINLNIYLFVASYSLVFALLGLFTSFYYPKFDFKALWLFIIPAVFYLFAAKKKLIL
jgi:hypothetical protein